MRGRRTVSPRPRWDRAQADGCLTPRRAGFISMPSTQFNVEPDVPDPRPGPRAARRPTALAARRAASCWSGLMGAGKTSIGRRLARALGAPVRRCRRGDRGRRRAEHPRHLRPLRRAALPRAGAAGGGAPARRRRPWCWRWAAARSSTRRRARGSTARAVSVWLRADLDTLLARTARKRGTRPLLEQRRPARDPGRPDGGALSDLRRGRPHGRFADRAARVRWSSGSWRMVEPAARRA